ncbi:hypothetical protein HARCEL1_10760 [Halococcoides cellulosivorans]|uniref:Blue (type 1) copper domain-containing protein n=1 Tax=Halococcoides cellulosivorans TaxID=1679096 RepID=A0A2R4X4J1_9EURY|nr:hypothetical protein HARCEL1_10760 [Halococcoides cellulosivorans]
MTRRQYLASTGGLAVLGLAGCSSGDGGAGPDGSTVEMVSNGDGHHFHPHVLRIEPGETVTWTLESGVHTATAYASANDRPDRIPEAAAAWDSTTIAEEGAEFTKTFEITGVYDYFCRPHEAGGMLGSIVVGESSDGPGLAAPQSALPEGARTKIESLNHEATEGESDHDH